MVDFELAVPADAWHPFGWADPMAEPKIGVVLGTPEDADFSYATKVDVQKLLTTELNVSHLGYNSVGYNCAVDICVKTYGNGIVLHIVDRPASSLRRQLVDRKGTSSMRTPFKQSRSLQNAAVVSTGSTRLVLEPLGGTGIGSRTRRMVEENITLEITLHSIGISFVAENLPNMDGRLRRELFSLHMDKFSLLASQSESEEDSIVNSLCVTVNDVQVDNYSETAVFPVIVNSIDPRDAWLALEKDGSSHGSSHSTGSAANLSNHGMSTDGAY